MSELVFTDPVNDKAFVQNDIYSIGEVKLFNFYEFYSSSWYMQDIEQKYYDPLYLCSHYNVPFYRQIEWKDDQYAEKYKVVTENQLGTSQLFCYDAMCLPQLYLCGSNFWEYVLITYYNEDTADFDSSVFGEWYDDCGLDPNVYYFIPHNRWDSFSNYFTDNNYKVHIKWASNSSSSTAMINEFGDDSFAYAQLDVLSNDGHIYIGVDPNQELYLPIEYTTNISTHVYMVMPFFVQGLRYKVYLDRNNNYTYIDINPDYTYGKYSVFKFLVFDPYHIPSGYNASYAQSNHAGFWFLLDSIYINTGILEKDFYYNANHDEVTIDSWIPIPHAINTTPYFR